MEFNFRDEVTLQGKIVGLRDDPEKGMRILTIMISKNGTKNFPYVLFFDENVVQTDPYKMGDYVGIKGAYESKPIPVPAAESRSGRDTTRFIQSIIAYEIYPLQTIEETIGGVAGRIFPEKNEVILSGTVSSMKQYGADRVSVAIYILNETHPNRIAVSVFVKDAEKFMSSFEKGDKVFVVGEVQTLPKRDGAKRKETIVAHSIVPYEN